MQNYISSVFFRSTISANLSGQTPLSATVMAAFCRSTGQATAADLHHLRPLPISGGSGPLVACRICDAVFSSSQALINHIGAHVAEEGGAAAAAASRSRQNQQRNHMHRFPAGPIFPATPRSAALFMPSRFPAPNSLGFDPAESVWPNQLPAFARSLFVPPPGAGQYFPNWSAAAEDAAAAGDCTKPYINQLEKCLPKVGDGAEENDRRHLYFSKLDLTLKL